MGIETLNPNHPVTREMAPMWHKIAAFIMLKQGLTTFEVTSDDIERFAAAELCIVAHPVDRVLTISLVTMAEGERLAREAGGLPE